MTDERRRELWGYAVWGAMGVVIAVPEIWAAFHAVRYEAERAAAAAPPAPATQAYRTPGGRVSMRPPHPGQVNAIVYFAVALVLVVGGSLWAYLDRPHDRYRLGEVMYG